MPVHAVWHWGTKFKQMILNAALVFIFADMGSYFKVVL
jgi:hypothetical protein